MKKASLSWDALTDMSPSRNALTMSAAQRRSNRIKIVAAVILVVVLVAAAAIAVTTRLTASNNHDDSNALAHMYTNDLLMQHYCHVGSQSALANGGGTVLSSSTSGIENDGEILRTVPPLVVASSSVDHGTDSVTMPTSTRSSLTTTTVRPSSSSLSSSPTQSTLAASPVASSSSPSATPSSTWTVTGMTAASIASATMQSTITVITSSTTVKSSSTASMTSSSLQTTSATSTTSSIAVSQAATATSGTTVTTPTGTLLPSFGVAGKLYYSFSAGSSTNLTAYESALGHRPASRHDYFKINKSGFDKPVLTNTFVTTVNAVWPRAIVMLTLEPLFTLDLLTDLTFQKISQACVGWNQQGIKIALRYAQNMNLDTNLIWGNQPDLYVQSWRNFSTILRSTLRANNIADGMTTLVWCPAVQVAGMMFNYSSFYPGDEHVDWVGLVIWGPNDTIAAPGDLASRITTGGGVNFYDVYCTQKGKPMMLPETSSSVPLTADPNYSLAQKRSWWTQLYSTSLVTNFPMIRLISWFEETKNNRTFGVFDNSTVFSKFLADLPASVMMYSD